MNASAIGGEPLRLTCDDGYVLHGHLWRPAGAEIGTIIINPATGVLARFYHRYARFLAENGLAAITYDYRGIGQSRPPRLRGFAVRWADWGARDFEAVVRYARHRDPNHLLGVVGHSIGGVLIGYAASAPRIDRVLTVGAQYAYWPDYAASSRFRLLMRWHLVMPALTTLVGFFPGRRLGWLEDLPAGVALDWSFRRARLEQTHPPAERDGVLARFAAVRAPIMAVSMTDDDYATVPALRRALGYFSGAERRIAMLAPADLEAPGVGHFALFHDKHHDTFWRPTLRWLVDEADPWRSKPL